MSAKFNFFSPLLFCLLLSAAPSGQGSSTFSTCEKIKTSIVKSFDADKLVKVEMTDLDISTGNLLRTRIFDQNGKLCYKQVFAYDRHQNPIEETVGDDTCWYTIYRTFSDDELHLKLSEWDSSGKKTLFYYHPKSHLLEKTLVQVNGVICQRTFLTYNDSNLLTRKVEDNGINENPVDLSGVTYRKITVTTPKTSPSSCFGLPEVVEERTIDQTGREALLSAVRYTYTPFGKVLTEKHYDANGTYRYTLYNAYDEHGRLSSKIDALGHKTSFAYDENSNLTQIIGPRAGQHKAFRYDEDGNVIAIEERQKDGSYQCTRKNYDKDGRVIEEVDICGNKTSFVYDGLGRIVKIIHPDGGYEEKGYDARGNIIFEKDPLGYVTHRTFDYQGNCLSVVYPDSSEERFTYNEKGSILTHTTRNGAKIFYTYDPLNRLVEKKVVSENSSPLTYKNSWGAYLKLTQTDPEGRSTIFSYDYAGRLIEERYLEKKITLSYDSLGRNNKIEKDGVVILISFDLLNRPVEIRQLCNDKLVRFEQYAYDELGNKTHHINSKGTFITLYDTKGQPVLMEDPLGNRTIIEYSYLGSLGKKTTFPNGTTKTMMHDKCNRPIDETTKDSSGKVLQRTEKRYDFNGNMTAYVDHQFVGYNLKSTHKHTFFYGPCNRLEKQIAPNSLKTTYSYDQKGRLKTIIKPDGEALHHEYDDLGRPKRYFSTDFDYFYQYDRVGHLVGATDAKANLSTLRAYDRHGNLSKEVLANGLELEIETDCWGHRKRLIFPNSGTAYYNYYGNDLSEVLYKDHKINYLQRDLEGMATAIQLPKGLGILSIERDPLSRWKEVFSNYFNANFDASSYDVMGNLLHYSFEDSQGEKTESYAYNNLNQLIQETGHTYSYDSFQNRLSKDNASYEINSEGQLVSDGKSNYTYDLNGNLLSDGYTSYSYDNLDRLTSISTGKQRVEFVYDAFHRRLSKKVFDNNTLKSEILYLWDGYMDIGTYDKSFTGFELRVLGENKTLLMELHGKVYIPLQDHRGSIVTLIETISGKAADTYRYSAFGEQLLGGVLSPWRFAGQRPDIETGLIFFGNRFYHPKLGRWITAEHRKNFSDPKVFTYRENNPMKTFEIH